LTAEVWAILGVGGTLLLAFIAGFSLLWNYFKGLKTDLSKIKEKVSELSEKMAHLEGVLKPPPWQTIPPPPKDNTDG
jgi:hypothetical protein